MGLLDGKVCLVSGAGQGLGRAISREMAAEGAAVVLLERNGETVAAVAQEIAKAGGTAHPYQLDVTDYDGYGKVVADVAMKLGRIDVLVNNAAINPPTRTILNDTLEDWRRTIAINLEAVYMGSKLVAPHMVAQQGRAHHPHRLDPGLCLERRLRLLQCREGRHHRLHEVDGRGAWPHNILVNAVAPGFMVTPMSVVNGVDETTTPEFIDWYVDAPQDPARTQRASGGCLRHGGLSGVGLLPLHDGPAAGRRWRTDEHVLEIDTTRTIEETGKANRTMNNTRKTQRLAPRLHADLRRCWRAARRFGGMLPRGARAQAKELDMWWWGEQELPGLQKFVDDSIAAYKAATVKPMLQDTAVVISQFQTAAAAGKAPDIQYLWNGIYHMESVWLGYLQRPQGPDQDGHPEGLEPDAAQPFRRRHLPRRLVPAADVLVLQQGPVREGRARPRNAAEDLGRAARRLREAQDAPASSRSAAASRMATGANGTSAMRLPQKLDTLGEAVELFIGDKDFRDPKYHEHWVKLEELKNKGYLNKDMSSLELYPGIDLVVAGKVAIGQTIGTRLPADSKATGGQIGYMIMPVFGKGKLAGMPIVDVQGLGISTNAEDPAAAAAFLEFLQSPERLKAFWDATGWLPSNTTFDVERHPGSVGARACGRTGV